MLSSGSVVTLRVCAVDLRPEVPVLRFWGLLGERSAEYARLHREIQAAAGPRLASPASGPRRAELCVGDLVLVELMGLWYRCCVVSRCGQHYRVFLLDEGCTVVTSTHYLAWGCRELFQVPPEVLGCVVADALPSRCTRLAARRDALVSVWTVEAMEFLNHLQGKEVRGVVRSVLMPRLIVLELPQLVAQLNHLDLARQVTASWFCEVLGQCQTAGHLRNQLRAQPAVCSLVTSAVPQLLHTLLSYQPVSPALDYFYPRLQLDVREPVLVTHVYDPHHIYCQLQSLSQEIECLSDTIRHTSDLWEQDLLPQVGSPCAACSRDGRWYRALLLELLAGERDQQAALVIFVDYGRKEVVPRANLHCLPMECFRMPIVTYLCALQGISDGGRGWSPSQVADLKALVLGKTVSACIKAFNSFENLYYVCLYGEYDINLNQLFGAQACCLASSLWQVSQTEAPDQPKGAEFTAKEQELQPGAPSVAIMHRDLPSAPLFGLRPCSGVFHDVCVSHIQNPSEFWLQLPEHRQLFRQLRQSMWNFYSHTTNLRGAGWHLQPGSVCCASGKEGACYRAVINRVLDGGVEIHLMDKGNTETVDWCLLKELLPRFRELPSLALKCGLAGVAPLGGNWSETSVSAFRELVLNKELKVHFLSVQGDKCMVEIFDQSQLGEISVSKLLAQGGHAECKRCEIPEALQKSPGEAEHHTSSPARAGKETQINMEKRSGEESDLKRFGRVLNPCVAVTVRDSAFEAIHGSKSSKSLPPQKYESKENLPVSEDVEMKPTSSYRGQLEVGSTVKVDVSYIENPSHFWCQLSKSCCDLEVLMAEIQEYCRNSSHPCAWPSSACLAQYSEDEKWYRALILSEAPSAEKVEVLFVDYGNRDLVSLTNLRSTDERFLRLEAQAFRCSLYNLIQPNGQDPLAWDEEAIQAFQEFVESSKSHFELKCTVFALASVNNKELFNIVDLMTPFQSACQFLTKRGVARPSPQKSLVSSVQLHSYYYSMHGIKIGSEEEVFITHVDGPWRFYCQLQRCADVLAQLTNSIGCLSETITSLETLQKPGSLCLAKYSDNHWYRAITTKTTPKTEVFFVDFGNTETIENNHLLPLPRDASDILLLPMQAIKCSLSDIYDVPNEATTWFKQTVLERQLKLIVVAKESDGKLLVELFDDNTQINAKLKEKFSLINSTGLCARVENETLCSRNTDWNERDETVESPLSRGFSFLEKTECSSEAQGGGRSREVHCKDNDVSLFQPAVKGDVAAGLLESYEIFSVKKDAFSLNKVKEESLLSVQMDTQSDIKSDAEGPCVTLSVPDPLQQKVVPALKALVYVSCINDPLDFYVQLQSDEAQLNSILESLNNKTPAKNACDQLLQAGDVISALYSEDSLWYRAVVKERTSDNLISVQYIDYGNTSIINVDQAHRLPEDLSSIPAISIHCFLSGLKCKPSADWAEKTVLYFTKRTSEALLTCEFVEKVGDKWEVVLSDHQGVITVNLADEDLASGQRSCSTESSEMLTASKPLPPQAQNEISSMSACKSLIWKFPEAGQAVKIYVSIVNGPEYFWSSSAETEDMKYIEEKIEEAENLGLKSLNDCKSCIKSGDICLAKYSQDGRFYRAKVCSIEGGNVFVRHVDYGSEEAVSLEMVRQIPCDLLKVPNQAFPCCLSDFESSEGSWLSEAKDRFYDMTKDLLLEAAVVETREDKACDVPLCVVKLEASGKSINEEMKPLWKANKGTGDNAFSDLENPLKENRCSNNDMGLCLKTEATGACGLAQEESESALLCSEPCLGETAECLNTVGANVSVGAAEYLSGKTDDRCETAEHQSNFDGETSLLEGCSSDGVSLEPRRSCNLPILRSERKAAEQELSETLFGESAKLKAELPGSALAASLSLGNDQEQLRLPVLPGQSSSGDETGLLVALDQLQTQSSYNNDLKMLMLKLEALSAQSSFGEEAKEALETVALEMQTASGSEAREKAVEQELFQLPVVSKETRELAALKCLDILPSRDERENSVPSIINGEEATNLIPSDALFSLGEKAKQLELNLSGAHKVEAIEEDWMEVNPPSLRLTSSGSGPEKQVNLKTHDMLSVMGAKIEHLLELVQPSQEGREEDLVGLEHTALQSSTNSESQFSFCTENLINRRPVCTIKSCDCKVETLEEWQKEKEHCYVDEWMKQDLTGSFKECGSTCVWSSDCKPGDEVVEKKQNEISADCSAKCSEYTCNLKGFAVGSKCMVWTSLRWCEARILEISYKGTRVLNLSSGREEIVDPENVWNGIPDWACQSPRSPEAITPTTEDVQSLTGDSLLQEKQMGCSSDSAEDPCVL